MLKKTIKWLFSSKKQEYLDLDETEHRKLALALIKLRQDFAEEIAGIYEILDDRVGKRVQELKRKVGRPPKIEQVDPWENLERGADIEWQAVSSKRHQ